MSLAGILFSAWDTKYKPYQELAGLRGGSICSLRLYPERGSGPGGLAEFWRIVLLYRQTEFWKHIDGRVWKVLGPGSADRPGRCPGPNQWANHGSNCLNRPALCRKIPDNAQAISPSEIS